MRFFTMPLTTLVVHLERPLFLNNTPSTTRHPSRTVIPLSRTFV